MLKRQILGGVALHQVNLTLTTAAEAVWKHWLISGKESNNWPNLLVGSSAMDRLAAYFNLVITNHFRTKSKLPTLL